MPAEVSATWQCYRLMREGWSTLAELEGGEQLSIDDVDLACLAINSHEDAIVRMRRRNKNRED